MAKGVKRAISSLGRFGTVCLFVVVIRQATVFQLYHGGDMMYKMRRTKPERTLLQTQGIFNLPHQIGIVLFGVGG